VSGKQNGQDNDTDCYNYDPSETHNVANIRVNDTKMTTIVCPTPQKSACNGAIPNPDARYTPATAAPAMTQPM